MKTNNTGLLKRLYIVAIPLFIVLFGIVVKLVTISVVEGPELRQKSKSEVLREMVVEADRGKIYSADGKLLATSMPVFDVFMDPGAPASEDFEAHVRGLAAKLAQLNNSKSAAGWENYLRERRRSGARYIPIQKEISYSELQAVKTFPLFEKGKFKGGLIYEQKNFRKNPLGKVASRTIGYDRENGAQSGIEGAFSHYLNGKDGKRLQQKVSKGYWKPLMDYQEVAPINGQDVVTTLFSNFQDIAHDQLLKTLQKYQADHGSVVLMEVKTGRVRAIANLGLSKRTGEYAELRNYAVWEATEPGSTFKLAAIMVAIEDGVVDTADIVDTGNGIFTIHGKDVRDSNVKYGRGGYGKVSLAHAFRVSSNVGMVQAIYPHYKNNPEKFVDKLYKLGMHQPLGLRIKGEGTPFIPRPNEPGWSGLSLPWMCFGYEVSLTPLQVLSFYNAVANDGVMVKPQFVEEIRERGRTVQAFPTEVINPAICSKSTIGKLKGMLEGVVEDGTATQIKSPYLKLAGKTGTSRLNYWKQGREYQASFAGYFPADDPQYSCIVVINKPNPDIGYYGSVVAAPIFKALAEEAFKAQPTPYHVEQNFAQHDAIAESLEAIQQSLLHHKLPDLRGYAARDIVPLLENHGMQVLLRGNGRVKSQSLVPGTRFTKKQTVTLVLG